MKSVLHRSRLLALLFAVLFLAGMVRGASEFVLRAGVAREDITPEPSVLNWVTGKPYGSVVDPLGVQTLVLDDGRQKMALVRWDLVDVSESARDEVRQAVGTALGMPGTNIMVNASHTHSAPWAPVYRDGYRGQERDTWWVTAYMPSQNDHPPFKRWMGQLLAATVKSAQRAAATARPVTVAIARVAVGEYLYNRRPRAPEWGMADPKARPPADFKEPEVLLGGATFGPMDRTMTLVSFRDAEDKAIASLFHLACHAVSIYPSNRGLSADWPGAASGRLAAVLGGDALFLQGCAGDITPWQRGPSAVAEMAAGLAKKAELAARHAPKLIAAPLHTGLTTVKLPLTPQAKKRLAADDVAAEVQVIACGPLAIVALPGEPLTDVGTAIRERSPFSQTLVLGYSNGNGVHYVGMPGEKARGGYEAGLAGAGTDECGSILVEAASRVLREVFGQAKRSPTP